MMDNETSGQADTSNPPSRVQVEEVHVEESTQVCVAHNALSDTKLDDFAPTQSDTELTDLSPTQSGTELSDLALARSAIELTQPLHDLSDSSDDFGDYELETELTVLTSGNNEVEISTMFHMLEFDITENEIKRRMKVYPFGICNLAMPFQYFVAGFIGAMPTGILYGILIGSMSADANYYVSSQAVVLVHMKPAGKQTHQTLRIGWRLRRCT